MSASQAHRSRSPFLEQVGKNECAGENEGERGAAADAVPLPAGRKRGLHTCTPSPIPGARHEKGSCLCVVFSPCSIGSMVQCDVLLDALAELLRSDPRPYPLEVSSMCLHGFASAGRYHHRLLQLLERKVLANLEAGDRVAAGTARPGDLQLAEGATPDT